jgi:hypothetical protein
MLEARRFVVRRVAVTGSGARFDLADPDTATLLGEAEERPGPWPAWLLTLLPRGRRPGIVEFREPPDGSLVFSVRRGTAPFRPRADVLDALDQPVGQLFDPLPGPGHWITDPFGRPVAEARAGPLPGTWQFLDPAGRPVGEVLRRPVSTGGWEAVVSARGEAADHPFAKMLLLAAVLELDRLSPAER